MIISVINRVFYFIGFLCSSQLYSSRLVNCSTSQDAICYHDKYYFSCCFDVQLITNTGSCLKIKSTH